MSRGAYWQLSAEGYGLVEHVRYCGIVVCSTGIQNYSLVKVPLLLLQSTIFHHK